MLLTTTDDPQERTVSDSSHQAKQALQGAHKFDLAVIGAGAVALLGSLLPYYTVSIDMMGVAASSSANAWHGLFGWFGVLAAVIGSGLVLAHLLGTDTKVAPRTGALVAYAVAAVSTILALFIYPGGCDELKTVGVNVCDGIDFGRGVGYWLTLLAVLAGLTLAWLRRGEGSDPETPTA